MKAVILAGGYATRLHPYTSYFPKTLLSIGGKPILEWTLDGLAETGCVHGVYIVTNDRFFPRFRAWEQGFQGMPVSLINDHTKTNADRLGSLGDLALTLEEQSIDDDLLVVCSDKMFRFSLKSFIRFFQGKGEAANTCQDTGNAQTLARRHGCIVLGPDQRILQFQEKPDVPASSVKSIAFYLFPKERLSLVRSYLEEGGNPDAPGHFAEWYHRRAPMYGWFVNGECWDVGDPDSLRAARGRFGAGGEGVRMLLYPGELTRTRLTAVLDRLTEWKGLDLAYLGIPDEEANVYGRWLEENPPAVPLAIVPWNHEGPGEIHRIRQTTEELGCTVFVKIDEDAEAMSFDGLEDCLARYQAVFRSQGRWNGLKLLQR